jgi:hypothetical protein
VSRARALGVALGLAATLGACTSPEAARTRAGGPGGDTGNHGQVVEIHEGSLPYWRTRRLLADELTTPGNRTPAVRAGRTEAPAASPR